MQQTHSRVAGQQAICLQVGLIIGNIEHSWENIYELKIFLYWKYLRELNFSVSCSCEKRQEIETNPIIENLNIRHSHQMIFHMEIWIERGYQHQHFYHSHPLYYIILNIFYLYNEIYNVYYSLVIMDWSC